MFPRFASSAISRRAAGADAMSRLTLIESIATPGLLPTYRRNSYAFESLIHGISTWPDDPPCVTSFSSAPVETRISAPVGSFVSQETTQRCPKNSGFGFASIFPVISPVGSVLFTAGTNISCYDELGFGNRLRQLEAF